MILCFPWAISCFSKYCIILSHLHLLFRRRGVKLSSHGVLLGVEDCYGYQCGKLVACGVEHNYCLNPSLAYILNKLRSI